MQHFRFCITLYWSLLDLIYPDLQFSMLEGEKIIWTENKGSNGYLKHEEESMLSKSAFAGFYPVPLLYTMLDGIICWWKVHSSVAKTVAASEKRQKRGSVRSLVSYLWCTMFFCQAWINLLCFPSVCGQILIKSIQFNKHSVHTFIYKYSWSLRNPVLLLAAWCSLSGCKMTDCRIWRLCASVCLKQAVL